MARQYAIGGLLSAGYVIDAEDWDFALPQAYVVGTGPRVGQPVLALSPNPGANAATFTSASFTVTSGHVIFALTMSRGGSAQPTITDSLGGTWTPLSAGLTLTSMRARLYYKVSTGAAQTITIAATGASTVAGSLVSVSDISTDFSNFAEGTELAGDPTVTLATLASTSGAIYFGAAFGSSSFTTSAGYTELNDGGPATNCRVLSGYDRRSPTPVIAVTSTNTDSALFGIELKLPSTGPTAYTLPADAGAYALSGATADLEKSRFVTAVAGSYALTGQPATLTKGAAVTHYNMPAVAGSYALTGQTAGLYRGREVLAVAGSYALSGATASLEYGREVLAVPGSYALTGNVTSLELGREVLADAGSYALTGTPVNLLKPSAYAIIGLPGAYALTGTIASLEWNREALALGGSYALTGQTTSMELGKEVLAVAGSYALSGQTASLEYGREVLALPASYALTGTAATFRHAWKTTAVAGAYALSGQPAAFARTWKTIAVAGSYTLSGLPANLLTVGARAIIGLPGAYALTGTTTSLEVGREVLATGGSYALSGQVVSLEKGREVLADAGSYALTGTPATLLKIGAGTVLAAEAGSYALTGSPVTLVWSGEVVVTPPGGGGMPWYGRPSGGRVPSKQLRKAVKELIARQERRKKPKKAKELAKELIASIKPQGLGVAEKQLVVGLLVEGLQELWPIYFASETIHDKRAVEKAVLFLLAQTMQRIADEEEDEEAALLLMSAA